MLTTTDTDTMATIPPGTWRLDPVRTTMTVTAKKLGFITVPATLTVSAGTIEVDVQHQVTRAEVVVDAGSYTSSITKRDNHIRSADFLDADNHPDLVFGAGGVSQDPESYRLEGSVTVKGQAFPMSVDISSVEFDAREGAFVARATIDRNAIGVDKLPSLIIGRDLELTVTATALMAEA